MKESKKGRITYYIITLICIIFALIYEYFSYGEYSNFMRFMFIAPLLGSIPYSLPARIYEKLSRCK